MFQPCTWMFRIWFDSTESLVGCVEVIVLNPSHPDRVVLIHSDSTQPSIMGQVVPIAVIGTQPASLSQGQVVPFIFSWESYPQACEKNICFLGVQKKVRYEKYVCHVFQKNTRILF